MKRIAGGRVLCAFALTVALPACGGGGRINDPDPVPSPTPTPPTTSVVFQEAFPPLGAGDGVSADVAVPNSGTVRATMDWTFATNTMALVAFSGTTCTDLQGFFNTGSAPGCTVLGQTQRGVKPGVLSFNLTAAQTVRILVVNLGPTNESGVVQITLTR